MCMWSCPNGDMNQVFAVTLGENSLKSVRSLSVPGVSLFSPFICHWAHRRKIGQSLRAFGAVQKHGGCVYGCVRTCTRADACVQKPNT